MEQSTEPNEIYQIPQKYRRLENLHIVFWLIKDLCWCVVYKPLALLMILPTLMISVIISYNNWNVVSERCHNLAVTLWISANSYWMISEFGGFDEQIVYGAITYKHLAVIPFVLGLIPLAYYYLFIRLGAQRKETPSPKVMVPQRS